MKLGTNEVFIYYDFPIVFSSTDEKGNDFLCVFIEETENSLRYLCAPISPTTLMELQHNERDVRSVFEYTEGKILNLLLNALSEEPVEAAEIEEDITRFLPDEGLFIGPDNSIAPQSFTIPVYSGLDFGPLENLPDYASGSTKVDYHILDKKIETGAREWQITAA